MRIAGIPGDVRCQDDRTWQAPTGTVRLTYRFREDTSVSWKYTRGWKPGSFNATVSPFTGPTSAEPETIDSFEANLRGSWFQGRLGLDASLFYYIYNNYQIFTAQQLFGAAPEFVIINADDAEVYGSEVDLVGRPWSGAFFNMRFAWLESRFLDFLQTDQVLTDQAVGTPFVVLQRQNSGNPLLNSPRFKISLTGEQTFPLGRYGSITGRYDGVWTDTTYYDATRGRGLPNVQGQQFLPENTLAQVPYWQHNVRLSWRSPSGTFEVAGWIRNLENQVYKSFAFHAEFLKTSIFFVGDPRTYGGSVVVNF